MNKSFAIISKQNENIGSTTEVSDITANHKFGEKEQFRSFASKVTNDIELQNTFENLEMEIFYKKPENISKVFSKYKITASEQRTKLLENYHQSISKKSN